MIYFIGAYLLVVNLDALLVMAEDKHRAKKGRRRIPEAVMFLLAVLGGSPGILAGMYLFRHKTLHQSFTVGMPLILFFETVLLAVILYLIQ